MKRVLTWSYGGGTQSVAIAVLIAKKRLPVPECIVIADTAREASETWEYLDEYVQPLLATVGARVEIAPHALATTKGLYAKNGDLLLPAFLPGADGSTSKLPTLCSNEWKKRVVRRYLTSIKKYGPKNPITTWIGFSVDEVERAKPSDVAWQEYAWPLLFDVPMRRHECRQLVVEAGLPTPPRSACWMCPYRQDPEWRHLRDKYPQDFARAIELDKNIRARDEQGGVYLHRSLTPLSEVDLDDNSGQMDLMESCDTGYCWT